ncbi:MAG: hypothetical protein IK121_10625, partial [Lachnospiraceae bacterium]|nr:hypothetical protein [Lachnospiraceae bacterium]
MNARNIEKFHKKKIRVDANKCTLKNSEYASCGRKMRYRTEGDASHAIAKRRRNGDNTPLDIYYCSYCNGFHLTKSTDANR